MTEVVDRRHPLKEYFESEEEIIRQIRKYDQLTDKEQDELVEQVGSQIPGIQELYEEHGENEGAIFHMGLYSIFSTYNQMESDDQEKIENYQTMEADEFINLISKAYFCAKNSNNKEAEKVAYGALCHDCRASQYDTSVLGGRSPIKGSASTYQ